MEATMQLTPTHLPADVRWGFTREGLKSVLHHIHPIPVCRGITAAHMAAHWPGLSVGAAFAAAQKGNALSKGDHFLGYAVRKNVAEFHILHDGTYRIVRTTKDAPTSDETDDNDEAPCGFLVPATTLAEMTRDELRAFLRNAFSRRNE
jgi:hypothetical protein